MPTAVSPSRPSAATQDQGQDKDEEGADDEWHCELVAATPLPTIDLSVTLLSVVAGASASASFFKSIRQRYRYFALMFRIASLCMIPIFAAPAYAGRVVAFIALALSMWSLTCSSLLMSWQLLLRLLTMQEVIFMSVMNLLNWVTMAFLFRDARCIICVLLWWAMQLAILSDAMYRTLASASKSSSLVLPLLIVVVLSVFLRKIDVLDTHFTAVHTKHIKMELVDAFLNVSITLVLLVGRNVYRRWRAIIDSNTKLIGCAMLKSKLVLAPAKKAALYAYSEHHTVWPRVSHAPASSGTAATVPVRGATPLRIRIPSPSLRQASSGLTQLSDSWIDPPPIQESPPPSLVPPITTQSIRASAATVVHRLPAQPAAALGGASAELRHPNSQSSAPHIQKLRLVPTRLKFVDSRITMMPSLTPTCDWTTTRRGCWYSTGLIGLVLMVVSAFLLDGPHGISREIQQILWIVSFFATLLFVATTAVAMQKALVRILVRHFDVLFNFFHVSSGTLCLGAMLDWDFRCLLLVTINLWFLWVLFFDAITPQIRKRLSLTKKHAGVALVGVMLCLLSVLYSLAFDASNSYVDSKIIGFRINASVAIEIRTKSFFLNRMFPLSMWAIRLQWELLYCREDELVFIKGFVEYYCPLETLPLSKATQIKPNEAKTVKAAVASPPPPIEVNTTVVK